MRSDENTSVRRLTRDDARTAAEVLARAFVDSPIYAAVLSHLAPAPRARAIERVKRGFVEAAVRYHEPQGVWVNERLAGASIVMAPGQYPAPIIPEAWQSLGCATTGVRGIANFLRLRSYIEERHIHEPNYYLFAIGIDPAFQRRGLGKKLLKVMHEEADSHGTTSYLETDTEANVRLYESVGYRVLTDERVPGIPALRYWTMQRPAAG